METNRVINSYPIHRNDGEVSQRCLLITTTMLTDPQTSNRRQNPFISVHRCGSDCMQLVVRDTHRDNKRPERCLSVHLREESFRPQPFEGAMCHRSSGRELTGGLVLVDLRFESRLSESKGKETTSSLGRVQAQGKPISLRSLPPNQL